MNKDWSDEEDNDEIELVQPSRDMPESEDEEEDDEYDMDEIRRLTAKSSTLFIDNIKEKPINKTIIKPINKLINKSINKPINKLINEKRQFNPRLPSPNKYKKIYNNNFKLNNNEFPSL